MGCAVFGAPGKFIPGWAATTARDQRAHLLEAGVQHVLGAADATATRDPPARGKGRAPHQARGPDVAVDATLVAQAVGKAGLAKKLVELGLVHDGHLGADPGGTGLDIRGCEDFVGDDYSDGPQERIR
jgi:hypothetical protein